MSNDLTIQAIGELLKAQEGLDAVVNLDFDGCTVRIHTNSSVLCSMLENYYSEFIVDAVDPVIVVDVYDGVSIGIDLDLAIQERAAGKLPKESWSDLGDGRVIRKEKTGMMMAFGHGLNLVWGECVANDNQVINFINNRFMEYRQRKGALLFHSSAIVCGKRGVAISGISGAGKSTLALHLMNEGFDFLSNDRVLVEKNVHGVQMTGVVKHPRINPGTALSVPGLEDVLKEEDARIYSNMPDDELWQIEHKHDALVNEIYGTGKFTISAPLNALFVLSWNRNSSDTVITKVDLASRPELLGAVVKSPGLFYWPVDSSFSYVTDETNYLALLKGCDVYEVSGAVNFEIAVKFIADYLKISD